MQKLSVIVIGVIAAFCLFSTHAFAGSFSISWGNDRNSEQQGTVGQTGQKGPPDHAPAHGYRARHQYQYFPSAMVYHDVERGLYFYLSGPNWQISATLPQELRIRLGSSVSMELDTDKPYIYNDQHKKEYPPGHAKKTKTSKGKKRKK